MIREVNKNIIALYNAEIKTYHDLNMPFISDMLVEGRNSFQKNANFLQWDWDDLNRLKKNKTTFLNILSCNSIFPIKEISDKLKSSKRIGKTSKWIINKITFNRIFSSILEKYPDLNGNKFIFIIYNYLSIRTKLEILKTINASFKPEQEMTKLLRNRRTSPKKIIKNLFTIKDVAVAINKAVDTKKPQKVLSKIVKGPKDPIDHFITNISNFAITIYKVKFGAKKAKVLAGALVGDSYSIMRMLPLEELESKPKKELYRNLFPLFKLLIKDKVFFSRSEFIRKKANITAHYGVYDSYDAYKIASVKTILGKTNSPKPKSTGK